MEILLSLVCNWSMWIIASSKNVVLLYFSNIIFHCKSNTSWKLNFQYLLLWISNFQVYNWFMMRPLICIFGFWWCMVIQYSSFSLDRYFYVFLFMKRSAWVTAFLNQWEWRESRFERGCPEILSLATEFLERRSGFNRTPSRTER